MHSENPTVRRQTLPVPMADQATSAAPSDHKSQTTMPWRAATMFRKRFAGEDV